MRKAWLVPVVALVAACDLDLGGDLLGGLTFPFPPLGSTCPSGSASPPAGGLAFQLTPAYFASFGATPGELDLFSPSSTLDVALGGSVGLTILAGDGSPFPQPFDLASSSDATVAITGRSGSAVLLGGEAVGNACIDVVDAQTGALLGGLETGTAPILSAAVVPAAPREAITNDFNGYVFAAGDLAVGVMYFGDYGASGPRVIDLGATLVSDRGTQTDWQTMSFPGATPGTYSIAAGSATATLEVVDAGNGARSIVQFTDQADRACFAALTNNGDFISGLTWLFSIDGTLASATADAANCAAIPSDGASHTITAFAGGQSIAIEVGP
jgi:hypothetical protein